MDYRDGRSVHGKKKNPERRKPVSPKRGSGNMKNGPVLGHINKESGMNVYMFYFGSMFTFCALHMEEEGMASI